MCAHVELAAANRPLQAVNLPHKFQHKTGSRFAPNLIRRISLLDMTLTHHHHAIGNFRRFFLVVGNKHAGELQLFMQLTQPTTQLFTHLRIERAKRLIEQQDLRLYRQRTRQRHTLLLPTRKLRREAVRQMSQLNHLQQFGDFCFDGRRIWTLTPWQNRQTKRDIVENGHMTKQRIVLEYESHFTVASMQTTDVGAVKTDMPAGLMLQPGNNAQQRGFARAGWPQQRDHLT